MKYELAKQLKDAGFPQDANYGTYFYNEAKGKVFIDENVEGLSLPTYVRLPTLSELIEACGDDFAALHKQRDWIADGKSITGWGATAEEAFAKLWLAIRRPRAD
jgi:hypothetical protein